MAFQPSEWPAKLHTASHRVPSEFCQILEHHLCTWDAN